MKIEKTFARLAVVLALLVSLLAILPNDAQAQAQGDKTVWTLTQGQPTAGPSKVWVDASAFCSTSGCGDFCTVLNHALSALQQSSPAGGVVDARGIVAPSGGHLTCGNGNPWGPPAYTQITVPSTVLLPAAIINLTGGKWILPNNTMISGEGPKTSLDPNSQQTFITVGSGFGDGELIDMGHPDICPSTGCSGVAIEHLVLADPDPGNVLNGIVNCCSQSQSYVNDVGFSGIGGTGISIEAGAPGAANSGPYSNINFAPGPSNNITTSVSMRCVDIEVQTRGLRGITCNGNSNTATPANLRAGISVNASNNTIENVFMQAFWDGVEIGNNGLPVGNIVISNVEGAIGGPGGVTNTVHICGSNHTQSGTFGACATPGPVTDVTILGVTNLSGSTSASIEDDVTGTSIAASDALHAPLSSGMYVLGEPVGGSYSRFATSPNNSNTGSTVVPTWVVGTTPTPGFCNTPGALYSNRLGSSGSAVFVCSNSRWQSLEF